MRLRSVFISLPLTPLFLSGAAAQETKSFKLEIGSTTVEIDPGEVVEITLPDGSKTKVKLTRNEFANFATDSFSFTHPSSVSVTKSRVAKGITQYLMVTAVGTSVIVQDYKTLDPTKLTDSMFTAVTREEAAAGAHFEKKPHTREVAGRKLVGLKAIETNGDGDDVQLHEVLAYKAKAGGILIITKIDTEKVPTDGIMLTKFWETLKLK